ncbi:hypothetical protein B7Z17_01795, partial [Candidatus Saccharibacteria bacterium 32-49-10]
KPDAPIGIALQSFSSPVARGMNSAITIKTNADAACSIKLTYNNKELSKDMGLIPKTADEYGVATWSWKVESGRPPGTYPVEVTCANDKNIGYYMARLVVVEQLDSQQ